MFRSHYIWIFVRHCERKLQLFSILLRNAYQMIFFHEIVWFFTWIKGFFSEIRKIVNFEKLSKFADDCLFPEKRFLPSKSYLRQSLGRKICRWWLAVLFILWKQLKLRALWCPLYRPKFSQTRFATGSFWIHLSQFAGKWNKCQGWTLWLSQRYSKVFSAVRFSVVKFTTRTRWVVSWTTSVLVRLLLA